MAWGVRRPPVKLPSSLVRVAFSRPGLDNGVSAGRELPEPRVRFADFATRSLPDPHLPTRCRLENRCVPVSLTNVSGNTAAAST